MDTNNLPASRVRKAADATRSYGEFGIGEEGAAELGLYLEALRRLLVEAIDTRNDELGKKLWVLIRNAWRDLGITRLKPCDTETPFADKDRKSRTALLRSLLRCWPAQPVLPSSGLEQRVNFLARTFGLAEHETAILGLLARRETISRWEHLLEKIVRIEDFDHARAYAVILDMPRDVVDAAFSERGAFVKQGIADHEYGSGGCYVSTHEFIDRFLANNARTEMEMVAALTPVLPSSSLGVRDYAHMSAELGRAARLIGQSLASGERANILLYGVPGAGKTEFARLIASLHGAVAVSVGEADEDGDEPNRSERLSHLRLCRKLAGRNGAAVLVIDEAEDLFLAGIEKRGSKLWLNKLVEDGSGPHIWIVNEPELLGETVVRRMDMAIRFDMPKHAARRHIVEQVIARETGTTGADRRLVNDMAELGVSPALVTAALRTGARIGEDAAGMVGLARDLADASGRMQFADGPLTSGAPFDPALSLADCDLVALTASLVTARTPWSLLLSGPPGTGKSAFARHLAERAGCDLVCRSGADLLGMFVGQTEKAIARAFAEAERSESILLIDEADSFLANRDTAQRNWEVSMTNEMLRQMERGRVRFIATTNRAGQLDPASARRFTLHAAFTPLDSTRARHLFATNFGQDAPSDFDRIAGLTPGDFAQIRRRADTLGETDAAILVAWLNDAVEAREGSRRRMGF